MSKMFIRVKKDGFIYEYNEYLAKNQSCEVITEQEAFPERFITPEVEAKIEEITAPKRGRKPRKKLDVSTDIPEEPVYTDSELAIEAAQGWPE